MNQTEYMKALQKCLRHLPKEDLARAIDYFEEYFADAGPENEEQAIRDLGNPEEAAEQIIANMAIANTKEPVTNVKKGLDAIWVGILVLFAAPIALPLALVLVLLVLLMILTILLLIFSGFIFGASLIITSPISIIAGFVHLFSDFAVFLSCLGIGLASAGLGLIIVTGMVFVFRNFMNFCIRQFGKIAHKGKTKTAQSCDNLKREDGSKYE